MLIGNLLTFEVDAIVNPANITLQGRGGLSGQILAAGGSDMISACKAHGLCKPGNAVTTPGFGLPCRFVIHAVGPDWRGGNCGEDAVLARCYQSVLAQAKANDIRTLALPAISTGIFGYPIDLATAIAVQEVTEGAAESGLAMVVFVCRDAATLAVYEQALSQHE